MQARELGAKLASVGFGLAALAMVGLTVSITWAFGSTLALDPWDKFIQSAASVSVDVMGFLLAFAVGLLIKQRRWLASALFCLPLVCYVGYSMQSVIGFGSVVRVAKDMKVQADVAADKQAVQEQNAFAAQTKQENLEWMRGTAYSRAQRKDRQSLMAEIRDESNKPLELKIAKSEGVVGDPQAEMLASMLSGYGVKARDIQMAQVVWLAVLLVMGKALGSFCTGYFWPRRAEEIEEEAEAATRPTARAPRPPRRPMRAPLPTTDSEDESADEAAIAAAMKDDVARAAMWRNQIEQFREEATYADPHSRVTSTDFYHHYLDWAELSDVHEYHVMSHNRFGRVCTAMGVPRNESAKTWYFGFALRPLVGADAEAVEAPQLQAA